MLRDKNGRFMSSKSVKEKSSLDFIGLNNTIKKQDERIQELKKDVCAWRVIALIFVALSVFQLGFFAYSLF